MQLLLLMLVAGVLVDLSVSSVGSEAMQLPSEPPANGWPRNAFSILGRIGGDATEMEQNAAHIVRAAFSILGRIGGDATASQVYAQIDASFPFSILGRIGGDATFAAATDEGHPTLNFQYPRSDRRRCNRP